MWCPKSRSADSCDAMTMAEVIRASTAQTLLLWDLFPWHMWKQLFEAVEVYLPVRKRSIFSIFWLNTALLVQKSHTSTFI
jgi:hypothetical protein